MTNSSNTEQAVIATTLDALARQKTGEVKRDQIIKVRPSMLAVESGFNVRGIGLDETEYWNLPHVVEHVNSIALAYKNGEHVPPIVVKFDKASQKALIRDGHHRKAALDKLQAEGIEIQYVKVMELSGDESSQQLLMLKSGNSLELSAVEKAEILHRLHSYGFEPQQIADKIGKSITYVQYMLKVYDLPIETKRQIQQGKLTVNKALTPESEKNKTVNRKANRKAVNKVIDQLLTIKEVEIDTANNSVKIELPLEMWEAFVKAQAEAKGESPEEKAFLENQCKLDLDEDKPENDLVSV